MPAIDLARLKIQAARLAEKFDRPEAFLVDLDELLDYYTNRTIRATQIVKRLSLPTYRTPRPVLRQIESELAAQAELHPIEAVTLTKALWDAGTLESRLLAAKLLGSTPSAPAIPALTRLPDWLNQSTDKEVRAALLTDALARVRRENPDVYFILLEGWLASPRASLQVWGLQALIPVLQDSRFENLPAVFRILRPAVLAAGPSTQLDLQACLAALERVSMTETTSFLRDVLRDKPRPMMLRTFRRMLPGLSQELQAATREFFREQPA
ncbi:MAG TPA: hypothetical protein VMC09_00030 [Anaerolineales bacterium]|nr:hypothetical protein [Anaerolineales bacterium]